MNITKEQAIQFVTLLLEEDSDGLLGFLTAQSDLISIMQAMKLVVRMMDAAYFHVSGIQDVQKSIDCREAYDILYLIDPKGMDPTIDYLLEHHLTLNFVVEVIRRNGYPTHNVKKLILDAVRERMKAEPDNLAIYCLVDKYFDI